jgi:hypothetical protein
VPAAGPKSPDLATCWLQGGTIHTLPNLKKIPTMVMVSQSSFAAPTEQCMSEFLTQAGVNRSSPIGGDGGRHRIEIVAPAP